MSLWTVGVRRYNALLQWFGMYHLKTSLSSISEIMSFLLSFLSSTDERVKNKILRIFKIWEQRGIYNEEFLADLNGLLSVTVAAPKKPAPVKEKPAPVKEKPEPVKETVVIVADNSDDFQPTILSAYVRSCVKLESETDKSLKMVVKAIIPDIEEIRGSMKGERKI
jgi:hypothetical protein